MKLHFEQKNYQIRTDVNILSNQDACDTRRKLVSLQSLQGILLESNTTNLEIKRDITRANEQVRDGHPIEARDQ